MNITEPPEVIDVFTPSLPVQMAWIMKDLLSMRFANQETFRLVLHQEKSKREGALLYSVAFEFDPSEWYQKRRQELNLMSQSQNSDSVVAELKSYKALQQKLERQGEFFVLE